MKYIKTYETILKHTPKFNINDPVKIINDNSNIIYIVNGYDFDRTEERTILIRNTCRLIRYEDKGEMANKEGFYSWIKEDELRLATPKEIEDYKIQLDSKKYNL